MESVARATVVLSTGHPSYREGLAQAIRAHAALRLVAVCANAESALREIVSRRPAVCLVDIALHPFNGLQLCQRAALQLPEASTRFVLMTSDSSESLTAQARAAGAALVVDKDVPRARLCQLLVEVANQPAR